MVRVDVDVPDVGGVCVCVVDCAGIAAGVSSWINRLYRIIFPTLIDSIATGRVSASMMIGNCFRTSPVISSALNGCGAPYCCRCFLSDAPRVDKSGSLLNICRKSESDSSRGNRVTRVAMDGKSLMVPLNWMLSSRICEQYVDSSVHVVSGWKLLH